jgi:hypothetical protein
MKRHIVVLAVGFIAAIPAGGFLFGFVTCPDCGWNLLGRVFIGCVMAFLTTATMGFPPRNEGGVGEPYNAWPFILGVWLLFAAVVFWRYRRGRKAA